MTRRPSDPRYHLHSSSVVGVSPFLIFISKADMSVKLQRFPHTHTFSGLGRAGQPLCLLPFRPRVLAAFGRGSTQRQVCSFCTSREARVKIGAFRFLSSSCHGGSSVDHKGDSNAVPGKPCRGQVWVQSLASFQLETLRVIPGSSLYSDLGYGNPKQVLFLILFFGSDLLTQ